jgi:uncharacterized integral membrane protein
MDSPQPSGGATQRPTTRRSAGRDVKRTVAYVIVVLAAVWLVAFIVSNSETVKVSFVFGDVSLSLIWAMIICALFGALLAFAIPRLPHRRRHQRPSGR